jgi:hypothetical protein
MTKLGGANEPQRRQWPVLNARFLNIDPHKVVKSEPDALLFKNSV